MKKISLACATTFALLAAGGSAQAGYYDAYGYHTGSEAKAAAPASKPLFAAKPAKLKVKLQQADNDEPAPKKKKSAGNDEGGGEVSGGARPSVSPLAPAKVHVSTGYGAGQIVIDQSAKKLYYTISSSQAYVYPVAVGKQGFKWTGTEKISREVDWPDWNPPEEMRERKPNLPERMTGGIKNPLGAKALYLGNSLYRIHGTNDPKSIGTDA